MSEDTLKPNGKDSGSQPPSAAGRAPNGGDARGVSPAGSGGETRRQLLKTGAGLGVVGVVGYGYLRSQEAVTAATDGSTVDDVPATAEFVFSWTGSELLAAEGFEAAVDRELVTPTVDGAGTATELFDTIASATAIDPRETGEMTAFGTLSNESGTDAGVIFESETDPQTVRDRLDEGGYLLGTSEYRQQTLWRFGNDRLAWDLVLCHLDGNRYALGSRGELEGVIDVRAGDGRRIGGRVIDGFDSAGDGLLGGGFVVPREAFADLDLSIATGLADSVEYGSAVISGNATLTVTLVAPNESVAGDLDQTLNALGQLDREDIAGQVGGDSPVVEVILTMLEELDTEVDGSEVQVTVADGFRVPAIVLRAVLDRAIVA